MILRLGYIPNWVKSELAPTQIFAYLGSGLQSGGDICSPHRCLHPQFRYTPTPHPPFPDLVLYTDASLDGYWSATLTIRPPRHVCTHTHTLFPFPREMFYLPQWVFEFYPLGSPSSIEFLFYFYLFFKNILRSLILVSWFVLSPRNYLKRLV